MPRCCCSRFRSRPGCIPGRGPGRSRSSPRRRPAIKVKRYGEGARRRIYLTAPRHPENFWSLKALVELFGAKSLMPNPALATLMALTPEGIPVEYVLGDANAGPVDYAMKCDLVVVTGSTLHAPAIGELCANFRSRGIPVALGGSYATLEQDRCRGMADFHFIGEAEYTWPRFLRDWFAGSPQPVYEQKEFVDMAHSPAPDWSLIDPDDYINIPVQTSRGCPNRCDFCEVIRYLGRGYRTKPVARIMEEVKRAHALGGRSIFFSDDNFYGNRQFTRELLAALIEWNTAQAYPVSFSTQITLGVSQDEEILRMCADARFSVFFLGVETPRRESLAEAHKLQNIARDIVGQINEISRYGIVPFLGMIVGFDHDDESIFDEVFDFITQSASPIAGIALLNAPRRTPLYTRLMAEGRIDERGYSGEHQLQTNIVPRLMSRERLLRGYWDLFQRVYEPRHFEERLLRWLSQIGYFTDLYVNRKFDARQMKNAFTMFRRLTFSQSPEFRSLFYRALVAAWKMNPRLMKRYFTLIAQYHHFYRFVKRDLPVS